MATAEPSARRTQFFQELKALCVPLSQLVLRAQDTTPQDAADALRLVQSLTTAWTAQVSRDPSILDEKLASYVFFPISHLLRKQDQYPVRVIEAVIRLIGALAQHGWKTKVSADLSQQLLLFLSFTLGGASGQTKKRDLPEETVLETFRALGAVITAVGASAALAPSSPDGDQVIPALGHSVTVAFDAVAEGVPPLIQLEALYCIQAAFSVVKDNTILAQFLPGTVSCLNKLLSPPVAQKTQRRVLIAALGVLQTVLINVLGDLHIRGVLKQRELEQAQQKPRESSGDSKESKLRIELTPSWLTATASQVKIALSSILRLRNHEFEDVQQALDRLCIALLDECHRSLAECQPILVETAMALEDEQSQSPLQTSLRDLVAVYPELGENVKLALYGWVSSLPRVMQCNDDRVKQIAVRNILRGSKHAASLQLDSSTLEDSLADSLRDSLVVLVKGSKPSRIQENPGTDLALSSSAVSDAGMGVFTPVLLENEGQKATRGEIMTLISNISSTTQQVRLATSMMAYVRDVDGIDQIASYWLAFELIKASYARSSDLDELLDFSNLDETKGQEEAFQELFDFSTSILSSHSDMVVVDWRLEAIALEVTAFSATRMKSDFRPELIDVLYPVATFLGSPNPQLRSHAITTLNILAASCGYRDVSELIVDNADYMVNSVSLRLNTFDISPTSTKVLKMMIHLTGPRLVPFLDDVVAAVFAALDNYHGYPVLVESLFSVLSEVVTQGVKSDALLLEDGTPRAVDHRKRRPVHLGMKDILDFLERRRKKRKQREDEAELIQGHPKEPWGPEKSEAKSLLDKLENPDEDEDEPETAVEETQKTSTPTYTLLSRVLTLTQHYLTSPTPTLRKSLLDLVATVSPALAPDENTFLPLINAVWPVVITRLHDSEPFVVIAACKALAALCSAAGDFLASRFKTEWSSGLAKWFKKIRDDAARAKGASKGGKATVISHSSKGGILIPGRVGTGERPDGKLVYSPATISSTSSGLGRFSQASQVWDAAVDMLAAIVENVRVDDDMFDEILDLVGDVFPRNERLREALEVVNADAVWLALYERGLVSPGPVPVMEGVEFAQK
ncbi:armadillo-type protein [Echria macrotheca]|uniref:Armadillo-type protein n=1 Tax=Echria macrotheca TaxID=438768 RepID=A0AAJ0F4W3_9PEZI|nr:armadillo-type protein [Echria macrotheca]